MKRKREIRRFAAATLLLLSVALCAAAQNAPARQNARPEATAETPSPSTDAEAVLYAYEFRQPAFNVRQIVIEHDAAGRGRVRFERGDQTEEATEPLELSPATLRRVAALWEALRFLERDESYQSDRQFPHLGTMRLRMRRGERERTAEFNWTDNRDASALVGEYRRIADQALIVFDLSVARENQPLAAPSLLARLDMLLARNGLSDPKQLIPLLREINTDERLPLIARNHASRLLRKIER